MLTGTSLDLTAISGFLLALGKIYFLIIGATVLAALWIPKHWLAKIGLATFTIAIATMPFIVIYLDIKKTNQQQRQQQNAQLDKAMAHFEMRCKSAGEKITRTVENVEGIFLMKVRQRDNYDDPVPRQFRLNDPYGDSEKGDEYINSFLYGRNNKGMFEKSTNDGGYQYIEAVDLQNGKPYRYTGKLVQPNNFQLNKTLITKHSSTFGVTFADISTPEDRAFWVAGSALQVVDLKTNEVIAERIGYMIDKGQGSNAGLRQPWLFAAYNACPKFPSSSSTSEYRPNQSYQTRNFVEKALKPINQQGKN
jgi:hypothetical protein